jgi:hypothetical protein
MTIIRHEYKLFLNAQQWNNRYEIPRKFIITLTRHECKLIYLCSSVSRLISRIYSPVRKSSDNYRETNSDPKLSLLSIYRQGNILTVVVNADSTQSKMPDCLQKVNGEIITRIFVDTDYLLYHLSSMNLLKFELWYSEGPEFWLRIADRLTWGFRSCN